LREVDIGVFGVLGGVFEKFSIFFLIRWKLVDISGGKVLNYRK